MFYLDRWISADVVASALRTEFYRRTVSSQLGRPFRVSRSFAYQRTNLSQFFAGCEDGVTCDQPLVELLALRDSKKHMRRDYIFNKGTTRDVEQYSAFGNSERQVFTTFADELKAMEIDTLYICGK